MSEWAVVHLPQYVEGGVSVKVLFMAWATLLTVWITGSTVSRVLAFKRYAYTCVTRCNSSVAVLCVLL